MIYIKRCTPPEILTRPDGPAAREAAAARDHYEAIAAGTVPHKEFDEFKVYRHPEVKVALLKLFFNKCAYCEIEYGGAPLDVEHFRPKGAVVVEQEEGKKIKRIKKLGYYWLASDWDNLLPSCQDCNRPREHEFEDTTSRIGGKANFFPLADEMARATQPHLVSEEERHRLLLHPCIDNPEEHLEFLENGVVRPRETDGTISRRGAASIDYYALTRHLLVLRRMERAKDVRFTLRQLSKDSTRLKANPRDQAAKDDVAECLERLKRYLMDASPFLALVRTLVWPAIEKSVGPSVE